MVTSLLGRRLQDGGVIVAAFLDRGELMVMVENPSNYLYTTAACNIFLAPQQELEAN